METNKAQEKNVYLHAYDCEDENSTWITFEITDARSFRCDNNNYAGIVRGDVRVTAYSSFTHGQGPITKSDLRKVAKRFLDGDYTTTVVDLGA